MIILLIIVCLLFFADSLYDYKIFLSSAIAADKLLSFPHLTFVIQTT